MLSVGYCRFVVVFFVLCSGSGVVLVCECKVCIVVWSVFWFLWDGSSKGGLSGFSWVDEWVHDEGCSVFV
jgi:hypothetical protein